MKKELKFASRGTNRMGYGKRRNESEIKNIQEEWSSSLPFLQDVIVENKVEYNKEKKVFNW